MAVAAYDEVMPISAAPEVEVIADGLIAPIGMAALPDGTLLVAEEGTGQRDDSAGVSLVTTDGRVGRFISGLPSSRDAGDLAGAPLVALSPDGDKLYVGHFGQGHLWTYALSEDEQADGIDLPDRPLSTAQLDEAMTRLNNVMLVNPFDITFNADGAPVVTDASGNGVAKENPDGTTRFFHRFDPLPNPTTPSDPIEAVPTGIARLGDEYLVTLTGGCPYPAGGGQLVAIDEARNQRTVVEGLNIPIDVAVGVDGAVWLLEFARFSGDDCFDGAGYLPNSGRLSQLTADGDRVTVVDGLNTPGAILPLADGSILISEVFPGRILRFTFDEQMAERSPAPQTNDTGPMTFVNVAPQVGLDFQQGAFRNQISMDPVAAMGAGLCWIDFDADGWLDLYLVNSHALDETEYWEDKGGLPRNALFRNDRGHFRDVSAESGADIALRGNGCIAADFNADGHTDIYITADGPNALLWNNGDGTFTEGAAAAGVAAPEWSSAAVAGDLNADGWPDLFVAAYIDLARKIEKPSGAFPQDFLGLPDRLYLNRGLDEHGRVTFEEVTELAGLTREERGLGALFSDLDDDGDLDLYIANDGHPNRLYANEPLVGGLAADPAGAGFRFVDLTESADAGDSGSGMGIAGGDYDGDGHLDLLVTNWQKELNALYRNLIGDEDDLTFQYSTYRIGVSGLGSAVTGWGVHLADLDHDTDQDMLIVNGRVPVTDFTTDPQLVRFYRNRSQGDQGATRRPGQFLDWTQQIGLKEIGPLMARGSALADYDNDGDQDLAINTIGREAVLLRNDGEHGNWLQVDLAGFQPGARVTAELPDGRRLVREVHAGSSYLASEDPRLHFGLGSLAHVPSLTVRWPDGMTETLTDVAANQRLILAPPPTDPN